MAERSDVRRRMGAIAAVLVLIGLPLVLAVVEAVRYHVRNRSNGTIVSSGREREYLLYVPRSYDRSRPTPLVISLHGGAMWPAAQMETSQWNRVADEHGFIVVYPSGLSGRGPRAWRAGGSLGSARDVHFISELIEPSKVPRKYFYIMLISAFTPIIIGSFFMILKKGTLDWMIFKL